jgi:broad specificity phosphatase PhoE
MAPTIHLIRHAQGYHNLSIENESIHDPDLTPLGEEQCAAVREAFPHHDKLTRLVASPLRRTLYTGILCFGGPEHLYPIVPLDVLQEVSGSPCDTGSEPSRLAEEFGDRVEVRGLSPSWTDKGPDSKFEPQLDKLMARGKEARRAIRSLLGSLDGDEHIAVVSHGCFLHFLTDDWYGIPVKNSKFSSESFNYSLFSEDESCLHGG